MACTTAVLNDSFLFSWPKDLMILDSLLIVHDSYLQTTSLHIFRKSDGTHLKSFGAKGRGPGELIGINSVNTNYDGSITVFDLMGNKIILFDIVSVLLDRKPCFTEYPIPTAPNRIKQVLRHKNEFIVKGNDDKMRYGFWNPSAQTCHDLYTAYPQLSDDPEANWSLTDYAVRVRLSPDGKMLAGATYIGGVLELFDISENGLHPRAARYFFEPRCEYLEGARPRWVQPVPESVIGFEDLYLTDDAIYGLVWGVEKSEMADSKPQLFRFDPNGNPTTAYTLSDEVLETIAVDNDGTIYGAGCDSEGRYKLCRYTPSANPAVSAN